MPYGNRILTITHPMQSPSSSTQSDLGTKRPTHPKGILGEASRAKFTEIPLEQYYLFLRNSFKLEALQRNGVEGWEGYAAAFDSIYDDACIEKLPAEFLD